jgi:hypothetical protein
MDVVVEPSGSVVVVIVGRPGIVVVVVVEPSGDVVVVIAEPSENFVVVVMEPFGDAVVTVDGLAVTFAGVVEPLGEVVVAGTVPIAFGGSTGTLVGAGGTTDWSPAVGAAASAMPPMPRPATTPGTTINFMSLRISFLSLSIEFVNDLGQYASADRR